ncbi:Uncharacterised protein [Chlamydia trachomatis]|nr:Uncharacterised protein [Chlamydia trachomatis]
MELSWHFPLPNGIHEAWLVTSTAYMLVIYIVVVQFQSELDFLYKRTQGNSVISQSYCSNKPQ